MSCCNTNETKTVAEDKNAASGCGCQPCQCAPCACTSGCGSQACQCNPCCGSGCCCAA